MINKASSVLIFVLLILFCGCGSLHDFSQRKYMPRHFSESYVAKAPAVPQQESKDRYDAPDHTVSVSSTENILVLPEFYADRDPHVLKPAVPIVSGPVLPVVQKKISPENPRKTKVHAAKRDPERLSRSAQVFGIMSIVFFFVGLGIPFGIIAIHRAAKAIKDPQATAVQIDRAKGAKTLGTMGIVLTLLAPLLLLMIVLSLSGY